ncbi:EAL domain-containing protein [Veronia pacifica]|uniref:Diguanylate cyclase n=1 Tax=Veronia pacifica TaxID=1080227 RepID=A0A1C3ES84_9GAMM|nr:EAL domain-containing protein [Veronia pacifica]ODA36137.1 diguanylate cyclase [Veronia pacifica]
MTLFRQIFTWLLVVFTVLLFALTAVQLNTTRNFLVAQQTTGADNALNNLGLSLDPYLKSGDKVAIESLMNAQFDGSFYREIRIDLFQDKSSIVRKYPVNIEGVPDWFVKMNFFPEVSHQRILSGGWKQYGELTIIPHPGYAYRQLWNTTVQLSMWVSLLFFVAIVAIALQVRQSLRPLRSITRHVEQLARNHFPAPIAEPKTEELKTVVKAINKMAEQLQTFFRQQAQEANKLREQAFMDAVSGLGNRSFFTGQLESWLAENTQGGLILIRIGIIRSVYSKEGYEKGDKLVSRFSSMLTQATGESDFTTARISQDEFGIIAPNFGSDTLRIIAENIFHNLSNTQTGYAQQPLDLSIGLAINNDNNHDASILLAQADNALSQAEQQSDKTIAIIDNTAEQAIMGKQQWRQLLTDSMLNDHFILNYQQASTKHSDVIHHEVFSAIQIGEQYFGAGQFLGMIEQLKMGDAFDKYVVERVISELENKPSIGPLAINLTSFSITNANFILWLTRQMQRHHSLSDRLFFEIPESVFVRYPDHGQLLVEQIRRNRFGFGVDNFGRNFKSVDYLNAFKPDYVKIDFAYTKDIEDETKRHVLSSICRTASNLEITTIATRVETKIQLDRLSELFIDGFQGYIIEDAPVV